MRKWGVLLLVVAAQQHLSLTRHFHATFTPHHHVFFSCTARTQNLHLSGTPGKLITFQLGKRSCRLIMCAVCTTVEASWNVLDSAVVHIYWYRYRCYIHAVFLILSEIKFSSRRKPLDLIDSNEKGAQHHAYAAFRCLQHKQCRTALTTSHTFQLWYRCD